jgi:methyl-accepting chemotaxis protein
MFFGLILVLSLVGTIFGSAYSYIQNVNLIEQNEYRSLETIASSRASHVDTFINAKKEKIQIAATHQELSDEELENVININSHFKELYILDVNGKRIASTKGRLIGNDESKEEYFINGKNKTIISLYNSEEYPDGAMIISTPQGKGNVLVAKIDFGDINEILLDKRGLGNSGETFLINKEQYVLSPLLKINSSFMKDKIDTVLAKDCAEDLKEYSDSENEIIETHKEKTRIYTDYAGDKIIGTHNYVKSMGWCLITKINEDEIVGPEKEVLKRTIVIVIIALTVIFSFIGWIIGRNLEKVFKIKKQKKQL